MDSSGISGRVALLLLHLAATLFMTGVIWIVQRVHYPLFDQVAEERYIDFAAEHNRRISQVVVPAMLLELACAILLLAFRPPAVPGWMVWTGFLLLLVVWLSTFGLQVPRHAELANGFDTQAHRSLVTGNWLRTGAWTLRSVLALGTLWLTLGTQPIRDPIVGS